MDDGLLPPREPKGKNKEQFFRLGELAGIPENQIKKTIKNMTTHKDKVLSLINALYLNEKTKRNYTKLIKRD